MSECKHEWIQSHTGKDRVCKHCYAFYDKARELESELAEARREIVRLRKIVKCEHTTPPDDVADDNSTELAVMLAEAEGELAEARRECAKLKFNMQFKLDVLREAFYERALFEVSKAARKALEGIGDEQCLQSLIPQTNERSCTHPITIDEHCIQCGAIYVEPKIERATPAQWQHRLDDIIEARNRSRP